MNTRKLVVLTVLVAGALWFTLGRIVSQSAERNYLPSVHSNPAATPTLTPTPDPYFEGPEETEPDNNGWRNADGPLAPDRVYVGRINGVSDSNDWFYFDVTIPGRIEVSVKNHQAEGSQLLIYKHPNLPPPSDIYIARAVDPPNHLVVVDDATSGRYYARLYTETEEPHDTNAQYSLTVHFAQPATPTATPTATSMPATPSPTATATQPGPVTPAPTSMPTPSPTPTAPQGGWQPAGTGAASGGGISNTAETSERPELVAGPSGIVYMTYAEVVQGVFQIYVRQWSNGAWVEVGAGSASGGGISNSNVDSRSPRIAVTNSGELYVAWLERLSSNDEIYVKRWNGNAWQGLDGSATSGGLSSSADDSWSPDVAVDSSGKPYVVWRELRSAESDIYLRYWDGDSWEELDKSASGAGLTGNVGESDMPAVTAVGDVPWVVWSSEHNWGSDIHAVRWVNNNWEVAGSNALSDGNVSNNSGKSEYPDLSVSATGDVFLTWQDDGGSSSYAVYAFRWDADTDLWVDEGDETYGDIDGVLSGDARRPGVAIGSDNIPYIAWHDVSVEEIYVRRLIGSVWEEVGQDSATGGGISNSRGNSRFTSVAVSSDNTPFVAWSDISSGAWQIYVRMWLGATR